MTDEAFAQAARTYGDTVYRVAYHALNNPADAEDVAQTVLLRLYEHKKEFESEEHMKHWLLRVAVNESRKLLRSFWRRNVGELDESIPFRDDTDQAVWDAVMALPPKYRAVVHLYYWEGYGQGEIGEILHISRTAVQTRMSRARALLKKELSDDEEGLPAFDGASRAD